MTDFDGIDFLSDPSVVENPYPYFEYLREKCPAFREPHHGVVAVTGYDDLLAVYRDTETFSSSTRPSAPSRRCHSHQRATTSRRLSNPIATSSPGGTKTLSASTHRGTPSIARC